MKKYLKDILIAIICFVVGFIIAGLIINWTIPIEAAGKKRFKEVYSQGVVAKNYQILEDTETGVLYLVEHLYSDGVGITVMYDSDGKVLTSK